MENGIASFKRGDSWRQAAHRGTKEKEGGGGGGVTALLRAKAAGKGRVAFRDSQASPHHRRSESLRLARRRGRRVASWLSKLGGGRGERSRGGALACVPRVHACRKGSERSVCLLFFLCERCGRIFQVPFWEDVRWGFVWWMVHVSLGMWWFDRCLAAVPSSTTHHHHTHARAGAFERDRRDVPACQLSARVHSDAGVRMRERARARVGVSCPVGRAGGAVDLTRPGRWSADR